jgi:predicted amidophosphoribosyltransferase
MQPATAFCGNCGTPLDAMAQFCPNCGAPQVHDDTGQPPNPGP